MTAEWCVFLTASIITLGVVASWLIVAGIVGAILEEVEQWRNNRRGNDV